jgi:hypothetical protein
MATAEKIQRAAILGALVLSMGCGSESGEAAATGGVSAGGTAGIASGGGANPGGAGGTGGEAGAAGASGAVGCSDFATGSPAHEFGPGQNTNQSQFPAPVLGPPKGGGCCKGSLDVVSLGNGGWITLEFGATTIVDEPGPDFIVFENAFYAGGDPEKPFAELATVSVSEDGQSWTDFPCTATAAPYGSCAGWHPTLANADENAIDPRDPSSAGGDPFDLADIGVTSARYVRITDRADLEGAAGVADIDAVAVVHAQCP